MGPFGKSPNSRREGLRRARVGHRRLDGRGHHAGPIVARGKGVAGGTAFVFNEK